METYVIVIVVCVIPRVNMTERTVTPMKTIATVGSITVLSILLIQACATSEVFSSAPLPESTIFAADGIKNEKIEFIWLELPTPTEPGWHDVRLFLAKTEPPELTIPNPNELRCILSPKEKAILGPERIPFEFKENGTFSGSYTYKACPTCIECYMNWDYTLEITGVAQQETVLLHIAIKHIGHNVHGSYLNAELELVNNPDEEPRITCNQILVCKKIQFVAREIR